MNPSSQELNTATDQDVLISCHHLGKRFCRDLKRSLWYGVQDIALDFLGLKAPSAQNSASSSADLDRPTLRPEEFWAVEDISFEVRRGQCLGLIGKNGAGKTTILKMLSGLIKPDHGSIELRGRVGGLIALGAGFNPLLTGRENVYVNGSILGISRHQIDTSLEEIEAFADIGEFMDAPVQSYSSGMSVRLGFAIAAVMIKPDILLLDEVLAVGDMGFTMKCLNAVRELAASSAVIFVSHNMQFVSTFCSDIMVLKSGRIHTLTSSLGDGIRAYMDCFETPVGVSGSGEARIASATLCEDESQQQESLGIVELLQGKSALLRLRLEANVDRLPTTLFVYIMDQVLNPVICYPDVPHQWITENECASASLHVPLGLLELNAGRYSFVVGLTENETGQCLCRFQGLAPFQVYAERLHWGTLVRQIPATTAI